MKLWALACGMAWSVMGVRAQELLPHACDSLEVWAPREHRWWEGLTQATADWQLPAGTREKWFDTVCAAAMELESLSLRLAEAEERNAPDLSDTLRTIREQEDAARIRRNAAILGSVAWEWWPQLQAVLDPPKPAVLHFGVHDRMKCVVCVPGAE